MEDLTCSLSLSCPLSLSPCVCLSHSEANNFRGGDCHCGRAALHYWQKASANLHCLWVAPANHHVALAAMSLGSYASKVSHHLAMFQAEKCFLWISCIHGLLTFFNQETFWTYQRQNVPNFKHNVIVNMFYRQRTLFYGIYVQNSCHAWKMLTRSRTISVMNT